MAEKDRPGRCVAHPGTGFIGTLRRPGITRAGVQRGFMGANDAHRDAPVYPRQVRRERAELAWAPGFRRRTLRGKPMPDAMHHHPRKIIETCHNFGWDLL